MMIRRLPGADARQVGSARNAATVEAIVEQLVLNAVDAGASAVAVSCDLGQFVIAVRDDGSGIPSADLPRVGQLACTSKAGGAGDAPTHGHRGEALFAIGLVSTLEVVSRTAHEAVPHMTVVRNGSRVMTCAATGARTRGTTATVRDLYFNRPVQRKVLLRPGAIAAACERVRQLLARIALAHCHVGFSLRDAARGALLLETVPGGDMLSQLRRVFRSTPDRAAFRAAAAECAEAGVRVAGYVCAADVGHRSAELQLVFVNRRALARRDPLVRLAAALVGRAASDQAAPSPARRSPGRRAGPGGAAKSLAEAETSHAAFLLLVELPRQAVALLHEEGGVFAQLKDEHAVHECVSRAVASALRGGGDEGGAQRGLGRGGAPAEARSAAARARTPAPASAERSEPRGTPPADVPTVGGKRAFELLAASARPPPVGQRQRLAAGSCAVVRALHRLPEWLTSGRAEAEAQAEAQAQVELAEQQREWRWPFRAATSPARHMGPLAQPCDESPRAPTQPRALGLLRAHGLEDGDSDEGGENGLLSCRRSLLHAHASAPSHFFDRADLMLATCALAAAAPARANTRAGAGGARCERGLLADGADGSESDGSSDDTPLPRATPERPRAQADEASARRLPPASAQLPAAACAYGCLPMLGYLEGGAHCGAPPADAPRARGALYDGRAAARHQLRPPDAPALAALAARHALQLSAPLGPRACAVSEEQAARVEPLSAPSCEAPARAGGAAPPPEAPSGALDAADPSERWAQWVQLVAATSGDGRKAAPGVVQTRRSRPTALPSRLQRPAGPPAVLAAGAEAGAQEAAGRAQAAQAAAGGLFAGLDLSACLDVPPPARADSQGGARAAGGLAAEASCGGGAAILPPEAPSSALVPARRPHQPESERAGAAAAPDGRAPPTAASAPPVEAEPVAGPLALSRALLPSRAAGVGTLTVSKEMLRGAVVVGQVERKWITVTLGCALALIDQHAADERVQLEKLLATYLAPGGLPGHVSSVDLQPAVRLSLSAHEAALLREHMRAVQAWGWHVRGDLSAAASGGGGAGADGHELLLVRAPAVCSHVLRAPALTEYLALLDELDGSPSPPRAVLRAIISKACRSAIMFGKELTHAECTRVVRELGQTKFPFQCAHGRPTIVPVLELPPLP